MSNDTINGTAGYDQLYGGIGKDVVYGHDDYDDIYGGDDDDTLYGGDSDDDWLYGGDGDDTIFAGHGTGDEAFGGTGNDTFSLSLGDNSYYGGDGADSFEVGFGKDAIFGGEGGTDSDTLSAKDADDAITITFTGDESGTFSDDDGDSGSFSEIESFELTSNADTVDGSAASSSIIVDAGAGSDSILAGSGDDVVYGGADSDSIDAGAGGDLVYGGDGNDTISGDGFAASAETVSITTANYSDTSSGFTVTAQNVSGGVLTSEDVANVGTFSGGFGANGSISDTDSSVGEQTGYDKASGLSETLKIDLDNATETASFSFEHLYSASYGEVGHWAVYNDGSLVSEGDFTEDFPGGGSGTVDISGVGAFDQIVLTGKLQTDGTDGSDFMITEVSFERSQGDIEAGDDTLFGGDGDDFIDAGGGSDSVSGGAGNDTIHSDSADTYQMSAYRMGTDFTLDSGTFEGGADP